MKSYPAATYLRLTSVWVQRFKKKEHTCTHTPTHSQITLPHRNTRDLHSMHMLAIWAASPPRMHSCLILLINGLSDSNVCLPLWLTFFQVPMTKFFLWHALSRRAFIGISPSRRGWGWGTAIPQGESIDVHNSYWLFI